MNSKDIAVVGMGVSLGDIETIPQLWAGILSTDDSIDWGKGPLGEAATSDNRLLHDTLRRAIEDCEDAPAHQQALTLSLFTNGDNVKPCMNLVETLLPEAKLVQPDDSNRKNGLPDLLKAIEQLQHEKCDIAFVVATSGNSSIAIALQRLRDAETGDAHSYAAIKGSICGAKLGAETRQFYQGLGSDPSSISYVLTSRTSDKSQSELDKAITSFFTSDSPAYSLPVFEQDDTQHPETDFALLRLVVQTSLALSNKLIPAGINASLGKRKFEPPLYLNTTLRPWFHDHASLRCAAIHDQRTGMHLLMEEIEETSPLAHSIELPLPWEAELAVFSATDAREMISALHRLPDFTGSSQFGDIEAIDLAVYFKNRFEPEQPFRLAIVFKDLDDFQQLISQAIEQLQKSEPPRPNSPIYYGETSTSQPPKVACIFPGLGFPGLVGRYTDNLFQMCLRIPEIRQTFDLVEKRDNFSHDPFPSSHLFFPTTGYDSEQATELKKRLASPKRSEADTIGIPDKKNLSSFCVALANWASWRVVQSLKIPVEMTFGQSLGELSALCAAGKFDFAQFAPIYWNTEVAPEYFSDAGGLAAVSATVEQIEPVIKPFDTVVIAVHISPGFQLLGGKQAELTACVEKLKSISIWTQNLPYPAIHTPYFSSLRTSMTPEIEKIPVHSSHLAVYSGMTTDVYPDAPDDVRAIMLDNLDHPVHLWQVTRKMYEDGARVMLQAGGGATMYSQAKTNIGADDVTAVSIDVDYRGPVEQLNHLCAGLITAGVPVDQGWLYAHRHSMPDKVSHAIEAWNEQTDSSGSPDKNSHTGFDRQTLPTGDPDPPDTAFPFCQRIRHYEKDRLVLIDYTLDLENDLHLADHAFVCAQSVKPLSECLTVLPMTLSLEIMAQAAAYLALGCGLTGFEHISASKWIALRDSSKLDLLINAERLDNESDLDTFKIEVSITSEGRTKPDISGVVIFSTAYRETLSLNLPPLESPAKYPLTAEQIYREKTLFHGPLYQCITGDLWLGEHGLIGELTVNSKRGMFADNDAPLMLSDPLLLDAVGQLIGLWAMQRGEYVYPIALEQIEIYGPTPPEGTKVPVFIHVNNIFLKTLYVDIEIQDGAGHVWMRIRNWGDWAFKWPKQCVNFTRRPTLDLFAHELNIDMPGNISSLITENMSIDASMMEIMSRTALSADELKHYDSLIPYPKRQKEWLVGRVVAKDAVRHWLASTDEYMHPASIVIDTEASGQPVVCSIPDQPDVYISISHTDKYTVALAGSAPLGIDIEAIQERDPDFVESFSSFDERQILENTNLVSRGFGGASDFKEEPQRVTLLWSAKESAGKAMGTGLPANPKQIELRQVDSDGLLCLHHIPLDTQINVNSWLSDNHFITIALNE